MKLGAHGPNRRKSRPRAQIMRKSIFTAEFSSRPRHEKINFYGRIAIFMKLGAHRPNRAQEPSRSSDHEKIPSSEKINFYGRIAIFMKLGAHNFHEIAQIGASAPRAQIMRKSIFTAESQFS